MNLNLGCGTKKKVGYIGVDSVRAPYVDVIADLEHLPFKTNSIEKIYCRHVLEHVDNFNKTIDEIYRVLIDQKEICGELMEEVRYRRKRKYIDGHYSRCQTEEHRRNNSKSNTGKIFSEEHKQKISLNHADFSKDKNGRWKGGRPKCKICGEKVSGYYNTFCQKCYDENRYGVNNKNWKGGISFLPYCLKFNSKLKESIRNRDNYICQLCGKSQEEEGIKLSVHHIHYDKENCQPDLITLCRSCNIKVNGNRDYWEAFFMSKLNKKGII